LMFGSVGLVIAIAAAAAFFMMRDGGGEKISEQDLWISTLTKKDTTSYISYLAAFPQGKFANEATAQLDSLRLIVSNARQAEVDAWSKAEATNTIAAFQNYVNTYANGKNVSIAQERIVAIKADQSEAEAEEQKKAEEKEDKVWARCERKKEVVVYEDYLRQYPKGQYIDKAINAIRDLKAKQDRLAETARAEQDRRDREAKAEQERLDREAAATREREAEAKLQQQSSSSSGAFTDSRDGQLYKWKRMKDGKKWMTQNLNYKITDSWCYNDQTSECTKLGRLYTWDSANRACPPGWRLPDDNEWQKMAILYGGWDGYEHAKDEGKEAYFRLIKGGDSNFSAQLAGRRYADGRFELSNEYGHYWTSSGANINDGVLYCFAYSGTLYRIAHPEERGYSCRCIQD